MKHRKMVIVSLMIAVACSLVSADVFAGVKDPTTFRVRKEDSIVMFTITKWLVIKEEGRFKDYEGIVKYDANNPEATSVQLTIQAASIDSRNEGRDGALRSRDYFHVEKYPTLSFESVRTAAKGKDTLMITGDFTIRDVTKRITVLVKVLGVNKVGGELGELVGFETTFTINRLDYGVGTAGNLLSDDVAIHLLIGAAKVSDTTRR